MYRCANIAKQRLLRGDMTYGFQVRVFREIEMARALAASGFHFAFIDLEHTALDVSDACQLALACADAGVTPLARIPEGEYAMAARLLDGGVQGIIVPQVDTAEQAREAVAKTKYRPVGTRWRSDNSIHLGWLPPADGTLTDAINEMLMLVVMLESEQGLTNIEEIAAVPGVDVISVGSSDLSASLGVGGDFRHPRILDAWQRIAAAAKRHGKGLRLGGVKKREDIARTFALGSRMVITGNDMTTLVQGMRANLDAAKKDADSAGFPTAT